MTDKLPQAIRIAHDGSKLHLAARQDEGSEYVRGDIVRELVEALENLIDELESTPEINLSSWGIGTASAVSALEKARSEP